MKNTTSYTTPQTESIQVIKTTNSSGPLTTITFHARKNVSDDTQQTVYIKFNTGEVVNFPSVTTCTLDNRNEYLYSCTITLNAEDVKNFQNKKIIKFQIADTDVLVSDLLGTDVNAWIKTIDSFK